MGLGDVADDDEGDQDAAQILNAGSDSDKSDDEEEEDFREQVPQPKRIIDPSVASDDDEDFDAAPRRPPVSIPTKPRATRDELDTDDESDFASNQPVSASQYQEDDEEEDEVEPRSVKDTLAAQLAAKMGNKAPSSKQVPAPPPPEEGSFIERFLPPQSCR